MMALSIMQSIVMLSVSYAHCLLCTVSHASPFMLCGIMLNVVMLSVMAPWSLHWSVGPERCFLERLRPYSETLDMAEKACKYLKFEFICTESK
jgi:hypothetical protein